jgi:hypothetical protein
VESHAKANFFASPSISRVFEILGQYTLSRVRASGKEKTGRPFDEMRQALEKMRIGAPPSAAAESEEEAESRRRQPALPSKSARFAALRERE